MSEVMQPTSVNCPNTSSQIFYTLTNFSGILINTILFIIIYNNTTEALKQYSVILRISCLIDIFSSLSQYITQARPNLLGDNFILTFSVDGILPRLLADTQLFEGGNLNYLLIPEYIGCYYSVCFCCVPFIYRYMIICWNRKMKAWELGLVLFLLLMLATFCSVAVNHASAQIYSVNILKVPPFNTSCTRFLPQFSETVNAEQNKDLLKYYKIFFNCLLLILMTYLITFFCAYRIHAFLKLQVNMTRVQLKIQQQVSYTLAIQASFPLIAFYGPTAITIILIQFGIVFTASYKITFLVYTVVPILNCVSVFLLITAYRNALIWMVAEIIYQIFCFIGLESLVVGLPAWKFKMMESTNRGSAIVTASISLNPFLAFYGPSLTQVVFNKLHVKSKKLIEFFFAIYTIIPLMNAITAFCLITTYRNALLNLVVNWSFKAAKKLHIIEQSRTLPIWIDRYTSTSDNGQRTAMALVPLISFFGPTLLVAILSVFDMDRSEIGKLQFKVYSIIPILNSVFVFFYITAYRYVLLNFLSKWLINACKKLKLVDANQDPRSWIESYTDSDGLRNQNPNAVSPML